jgi:hypothetical protein
MEIVSNTVKVADLKVGNLYLYRSGEEIALYLGRGKEKQFYFYLVGKIPSQRRGIDKLKLAGGDKTLEIIKTQAQLYLSNAFEDLLLQEYKTVISGFFIADFGKFMEEEQIKQWIVQSKLIGNNIPEIRFETKVKRQPSGNVLSNDLVQGEYYILRVEYDWLKKNPNGALDSIYMYLGRTKKNEYLWVHIEAQYIQCFEKITVEPEDIKKTYKNMKVVPLKQLPFGSKHIVYQKEIDIKCQKYVDALKGVVR